jgi:thioredoxin reductase (NADPH)
VKIVDKSSGSALGMAVDGVFIAIGYIPNNDVAKQLKLDLDDQGYIKTDLATMRTSMPDVYAAGDITGAPKQIVVAVAQGSTAAMTAFEDLQAEGAKTVETETMNK